MKRISLTVTCATVALWLWAQNSGKPAIARDAKLEAKIEKTLSNIRIQYRGGGKRVTTPYREQGTNYPEPRWAGPTPAYGLFARHVDGLHLQNVKFELMQPDERPDIILEDVREN